MVVLFISSLQYLRTRQTGYDCSAAASAEAGLVFAVVMNLTGSIFARAEWGVWWTPSPRLISSAAMLFLLIGYLLLRAALAGNSRKEQICAVFGIITFIDVPLVIISARLIRDIHQRGLSFETGWQYAAFVCGILGMAVLALALIWLRADMLIIKNKIESEI
jgi:heme exporter protein C